MDRRVVSAMKDGEIAIRAEGLGKIYRMGLRPKESESLIALFASFLRSPLSNYRKYRSLYNFDDVTDGDEARDDILWALRDVSFEVKHGEVVGIIGRNGAGKSTLLKILTRITPPSRGRAEINGRVASLLEVGTGFHQELTGRENIYLNGTILGMTKVEVDRKFDEIVDFSGVERFLDTPVKRYSSGMVVRLAFAVAAHLDPEVLIVDEVLAVGDAAFQKKCLTKMRDVSREGRTVLFVSHNMPAVSMLCSRALLLVGGSVQMDGPAHEVISYYLNSESGARASREWPDPVKAPGREVARLRAVRVVGRNGATVSSFDIKDDIGIEMVFDVLKEGYLLLPNYDFYDEEGNVVFVAVDTDPDWHRQPYPTGRFLVTAWIPGNLLSPGTFYVSTCMITRTPPIVQFEEPQAITFVVRDNMGLGTARGDFLGKMPGGVRPLLEWTTEVVSDQSVVATRAQR